MKKFLKKIFLFVVPIIVLLYPLDYMLSYFLKQSKTYPGEFEIWNDIYSKNLDCDIAIYGSSRAWVHFNSQLMEDSLHLKVYNFGVDGHNFEIQYLRHLEYIKNNNHPKTIILSLDIYSLEKNKELYQLEQFLPYMLWNSNFKSITESYIGFKPVDYSIPLIRYAGRANTLKTIRTNMFSSETKNYRTKGYVGMEKVWNADFEKAKATKEKITFNLDLHVVKLFNSFIEDCRKKAIQLIFVYSPEYMDGQNFVENRSEIIDFYQQIADKNNILFIDFSTDEMCLDKSFFYNSNHLNKGGSILFTKKLVEQIKLNV